MEVRHRVAFGSRRRIAVVVADINDDVQPEPAGIAGDIVIDHQAMCVALTDEGSGAR